jgi:hypothetical protein
MYTNVLADILSVIADHWQLIAGLVLALLCGTFLTGVALRELLGDSLTAGEYYSLSVAGGLIPIFLAAGIWLVWGLLGGPPSGILVAAIALLAVAIVLVLRSQRYTLPGAKAVLWFLILFLAASVLLRLALISKAVVPLYFDSAQHYLVIKNLIRDVVSTEATPFRWPAGGYYHMGFHLMAAFLTSALGADIVDVMLILGQTIVAIIPLTVFFLLWHETRSDTAGIFAVLLAGFGWYMPAYAVNWGKYPALASLPLIAFVMSLAYLALKHKEAFSARQWGGLSALLFIGLAVTGVVHSRSLIVFGIAALAWAAAAGWQKLSRLPRLALFIAVLLGMLVEINIIRTTDVFLVLFDPYWTQGLFVTAVVLFLAIFAQWIYPKLTFALIVMILLLFGSLFIPVNVPGYGNLTLLDRPFAEMILYLPLSLLGGLGLAGLEQSLQHLTRRWQRARLWPIQYMAVLFIGAILVNALATYTLYPADCCSIVSRDDLAAIGWMDRNLPPDARILISSTELRVLPTESPQGSVGADAGTWIAPLTDRATVALPYQSDFSQTATFELLCQLQVDYIYIGELGAMFRVEQMTPYPDRYRPVFSMPKAKVYQVVGCPQTASVIHARAG